MGERTRIDVFGIHYDLDESCVTTNHLSFTGHVAEVKLSQTASLEDVRKIREYLEAIDRINPEWKGGLNKINFYVAFVADQTSQEVLNECRVSGIGVLKIQTNNQGGIKITEDLQPVEVALDGGISHNSQKSPGIFEKAMLDKGVFKEVLKVHPSRLFDDLIRPRQERYKENIALEHALDYIKMPEGKEALQYVYSQIRSAYPTLGTRAPGRYPQNTVLFYNRDENNVILKLEAHRRNFKIYMRDTVQYRVTTKDDIVIFEQGSGYSYNGNLQRLLNSDILPRLKTQQ
ncbi:hypothetical protein [Methanoculleus sp.]|nr:hypothetical protein [Methanoculleus sp.]